MTIHQGTTNEASSTTKRTRGEMYFMILLLVVTVTGYVIGCLILYNYNQMKKAERLEDIYLTGVGYYVKKDYDRSVLYIQDAAEKGFAKAQTYLGFLHDIGAGVEKDVSQALYWYLKGAEKGDAIAQNNLGWLYRTGRGVEKDPHKAAEWFTKAAEQGDKYAQKALTLEGETPKANVQKPNFQNPQKKYQRIYTSWGELIYEGTMEVECTA